MTQMNIYLVDRTFMEMPFKAVVVATSEQVARDVHSAWTGADWVIDKVQHIGVALPGAAEGVIVEEAP